MLKLTPMLKLTATCTYRKTIKYCDPTGRRLTEDEFEKVNGSKLIARIELEIWSDRLALVRTTVPVFNGREGVQVGKPNGCELGDELWEMASEAALKAVKTTGSIVVSV